MTVTVRKVETQADFRPFFEFPWMLYKDDPNWVPPLLSMRRDLLDKKKNPGWEYMEGEYFTAWRGERIVGTITAHINHHHNAFQDERVGWFGFFDVVDDQEAASALLNTAAEYVKSKGFSLIRGPQSFSTHDECGLLVENFSPPVLLMPYNKPYYAGLIEGAGFHKVMDVYCFYYDRQIARDNQLGERLERLVERASKRSGITVRPIDRKNLKQEFQRFKDIYNTAWEKNWGFVPMTPRELDNLVASLGMFFEPALACFAQVKGEDAGFMMAVPNFNEVLGRIRPRPGIPEPFFLAQALWHWKIRPKIRLVRIPLMGVREQFRKRGVELAMFQYILNAILKSRYDQVDAGWILETNRDLIGSIETFGAQRYKTHRFYEKTID